MSDILPSALPRIFKSPETEWRRGKSAVFVGIVSDVILSHASMRLHDGTVIRLGSGNDQSMFNKRQEWSIYVSSWYSQPILVTGQYVVEVRFNAVDYWRDAERARIRIDRLMTALRLIGRSSYISGGVAFQPRVQNSTRFFLASRLIDRTPQTSTGGSFVNATESRRVRRIYKNLSRLTRKTNIAVRRFNRSLSRESEEDRIIDIWIGLEAIFSPGMGENTFRIALRLSHFMTPVADRRSTYDLLMDSYDLRSDIVHGRRMRSVSTRRKLQPSEVINQTQEFLRQALCKIVELDPGFDASSLDNKVLGGDNT